MSKMLIVLLCYASSAGDVANLPFDTYSGYFVSNKFEPDAAASFVVVNDQVQFDKIFGVAFVMQDKSHRLSKDALQANLVLAVIKRGHAFWEYKVKSVTVEQGVLKLRYVGTSKATPDTTFACPLIVSIPKGDYKAVTFIEDSKEVKTLKLASQGAEPPAAGKKLVVIAPSKFHASLADFLVHKAEQLPTELVALEDVLKDQAGVDDPEKLKRFLFQRWRDDRLGYALLVGDVDVMPVRYMVLDRVTPAAFDYAFYPSDLYYADLAKADGSFEDWNANRDSFHAQYFGEVRGEKNKDGPINEDQVDYLPDIGIGRWPVSTVEQAVIVARKSIRYEQGLLTGDKPGRQTVALLSVQGWVDSWRLLDDVARELSPRWQVKKMYYADGYPEQTTPPTEAALYDMLNAGVGLVLHTGHGETNRWDSCCTVAGLAELKNADRLPVLFSVGCSTAHFAPLAPYDAYTDTDGGTHQGTDHGEVFSTPPPPPATYQRQFNRTGLGEAALVHGDNGAVAYIGCNTGSQPCAQTLLVGFAKALGTVDKPRLGDAWASAVRYYFAQERLAELHPTADWYPPSIFFQGMKFMVFGDPTLLMPAADLLSEK